MRQRFLSYARGDTAALPWIWLFPFGWMGSAYVRLRGAFYDRGVLESVDGGIPVVSVGNLTFGGTGKTPCVLYLLGALSRPGRKLGVVSRGYGGIETAFRGPPPRGVGDEVALIARRHPEVWIATAARRSAAVRRLVDEGVDLVIADDAFQHRQLARSYDLVLLDAARPFGNRRILPAGMLREPPRALRRADAIVLTRSDEASQDELAATREILRSILGEERLEEAVFDAEAAIGEWLVLEGGNGNLVVAPRPDRRVLAFCGIGAPASFRTTLEREGLALVDLVVFPDHHRYREGELAELEARASLAHADLVCTEKDLQNLPTRGGGAPIHVPRLDFRIADGERLVRSIEQRLAGKPRTAVVRGPRREG